MIFPTDTRVPQGKKLILVKYLDKSLEEEGNQETIQGFVEVINLS